MVYKNITRTKKKYYQKKLNTWIWRQYWTVWLWRNNNRIYICSATNLKDALAKRRDALRDNPQLTHQRKGVLK